VGVANVDAGVPDEAVEEYDDEKGGAATDCGLV